MNQVLAKAVRDFVNLKKQLAEATENRDNADLDITNAQAAIAKCVSEINVFSTIEPVYVEVGENVVIVSRTILQICHLHKETK